MKNKGETTMRFTITIELNGRGELPEGYSTMAELLKDTGIWCLYSGDVTNENDQWDYRFWVDKVVTHRK